MPAPEKFTKTRLAPTPSGFLHLGNVLSFVLTSVLADKHSAGIFLRIDDLDKDRTDPLYILDIFDTLNFLKIPWSEGPVNIETLEHKYTQTKRLALYNKALEQLCQTGKVYACSCSRSQVLAHSALGIYPCTCRNKNIPLHTENTCWRLNTENAGTLSVNTLENGSIEAPLPPEICDLVVRK